MTFLDSLAYFLTTPAYAEEPAQDEGEAEDSQQAETEGKEGEEGAATPDESEADGNEGDEGEEGVEGGDEEDEEEEEEEEEPEDQMPKFQEECAKLPACAHAKTELDECTERVKQWEEDDRPVKQKGPKEDCVEEFFEYTHCISQCAAPKLFKALA